MKTRRGYTKRIEDGRAYTMVDYDRIELRESRHSMRMIDEEVDIMESTEYECLNSYNYQLEDYEVVRYWERMERRWER